jgi:asparagine synthase (glutamine-hydrolysing)
MLSFSLHFDRLSQAEQQPVHMADGSVMTWDGRLDNRDDFLVRLQGDLGADCTDARLIALAVQRWQENALTKAIGDWSLVYWDSPRHEMLLARDFTGNRPLYFCSRPEYFVWSTALEPLVEFCGLTGQINDSYMAGWLTFDPPEDQTHYREVLKVPVGHALRVRPGSQPVCRRFARFDPQTIRYKDTSQYEQHYLELFTQAVKVRLRARAPVWVELSGGYDSSSITCVASSLIRTRAVEAPSLQPVSVVTPNAPESDESRYIEYVEQFCGLRSVRSPFRKHFEPMPDSRGAKSERQRHFRSTRDLASEAGSHVLASGELGDVLTLPVLANEVLLDHVLACRLRQLLVDSMAHCRAAREPLLAFWRSLPKTFIAARRRRRNRRLERIHQMAGIRRVTSRDAATVYGLRQDFLHRALLPSASIEDDLAFMPRVMQDFLLTMHYCVAHDILSGVCGTNALSVTYPFAHRPLVEFIFAIPQTVLWSPMHPRAFLCAALRDVLPAAIITRRNKGYAAPALSRYLEPAISRAAVDIDRWQLVARGYADPAVLTELFAAFLDGSQNISALVHRLLSAEILLRRLHSASEDPMIASVASSENVARESDRITPA